MATLRILDGSGHTAIEYDLDAEEAVKEAIRIFEDTKKKGAIPFRTDVTPAQKLTEFDRTAQEITMVPRMAGGQ